MKLQQGHDPLSCVMSINIVIYCEKPHYEVGFPERPNARGWNGVNLYYQLGGTSAPVDVIAPVDRGISNEVLESLEQGWGYSHSFTCSEGM